MQDFSTQAAGPVTFPADFPFTNVLNDTPLSFVITDPHQEDQPIIFVNRAFTRTTGYSPAMSIGRNCRFLQGPDTDFEAVCAIRAAIAQEEEIRITLKNYRRDGTPFWNELNISPIRNDSGEVMYLIGVQREVPTPEGKLGQHVSTDLMLQEIQHRVKNHLAMVVSLIRVQSRHISENPQEDYANLARRVESLALLYDQINAAKNGGDQVDIGTYLTRVCDAVISLADRNIRMSVQVERIHAPVATAVQVGLVASELITNALKHAFRDRATGLITVELTAFDDSSVTLSVSDDGVGMAANGTARGTGGAIVAGIVASAQGEMHVDPAGQGTRITVRLPLPHTAPQAVATG